jgi:hypothetical protein
MKKIFPLVLFIIFVHSIPKGISQGYFNNRYCLDNNSVWSFSTNIISEPFGYTLQLEDGDITNPDQRRLGFLRLDSIGNTLFFLKIYQYDSITLETGYGGSFIKLPYNNGYSLTGTKSQWVINGRYDQGIFIRFDNNLDSIWTKLYTDISPHDTSIMFVNNRQLTDKGYIIVGIRYKLDGSGFNRANLLRVDSNGTIKWQKTYGPQGTTEYYPYDVTYTSDNGFAIGAGYYPYNSNTQGCDPLIIKVDSMGYMQWMKHFGNPNCREEFAMVDLALDGNIQIGTVYSDSCFGNDGYFSRIDFVKLKNNQEIIWDKKYGLAKYWNVLNKVRVLNNSEIIATGDYWKFNLNGTSIIISWILKTDSAGNEQWYREYELVNGENSENHLYNVISANDNGFVACGMVYPTPPDTGFENAWVLKVDSLGCQGVNDCWVGTNEIIVKTFTPDKPYVIYPNPATDKIAIEFHENSNGADIEIFDQFGRSQYKSKLSPNKDQVDIDISKWKPGLYVVRVILDERILGTDKIVKM